MRALRGGDAGCGSAFWSVHPAITTSIWRTGCKGWRADRSPRGCAKTIGEYNVLYQYILFIITRLSVPSLYAVKAVSFHGDAFLAGAAAALAQKDGKKSMAAFGLALLLPTIVLNGGMFAQCDSLYAALCAVGAGACAGRKARARGGVFCAVAGV